jgi:diadenosine tetraphosphate (Ap4A) HIT family hydrolase
VIYRSPDNPNSHLTAKERSTPSFPTKTLFDQRLIVGDVLDFGCGRGADAEFLRRQGCNVVGFDPHYSPIYPDKKFDTILCNYVLNVLLPEEQAHVLMAISELLQPSGKAYFSVRRDITKSGFRTHAIHGSAVYQCNVILPYKSILAVKHCEIYEYQHINQRRPHQDHDCPFCYPSADTELITESATAYAMLSKHPIEPEHIIVLPKQHVSDYFGLPERLRMACWLMIERIKTLTHPCLGIDGFTIQIDVGSTASQPFPHTHIHLIPHRPKELSSK